MGENAEAALKDDGSLLPWGDSGFGDSFKVAEQLKSGVKVVVMGGSSGAALKEGFQGHGQGFRAVGEPLLLGA